MTARRLRTALEPADLVELGTYQCYARLSRAGERLPAFHLRLDAPPQGDADVREMLAACSAVKYGRDFLAVAADRAALLAQIEAPDEQDGQTGRSKVDPENGSVPPATSTDTAGPPRGNRRNEGRPPASSHDRPADAPKSQLPLDLDQRGRPVRPDEEGPEHAEAPGEQDEASGGSTGA